MSRIEWNVFVDGEDMTSAMRPFVTRISVTDKDGSASDTCSLDFDDSGGQLKLPEEGASVQVFLQGAGVFDGKVDSVRSTGSRGGGRMLSVTAKGFDVKGKVKEPQSHHMDDATLQQFMDKAASNAGLSGITIDPAFANIVRDYWSMGAESFLHVGQKLARQLGGTFKIRGDKAVLAKRGQGLAATGSAMPTVIGEVGRNVISWNITPLSGRRKFSKTKVRYFDRETASFKEVEVETGIEADAINEVRTAAADEAEAEEIATGRKDDSEREGGKGTVELDLEVTAQAEGTFILMGARPGVDGAYRISSVTHNVSRSSGSTTSLEIKQPSAGAGKDERQPGEDKSGSSADTAAGDQAGDGQAGSTSTRSGTFQEYNRRYGRTDEN